MLFSELQFGDFVFFVLRKLHTTRNNLCQMHLAGCTSLNALGLEQIIVVALNTRRT